MHIHLFVRRGTHSDCIAGVVVTGDNPLTIAASLRKLVLYEEFGSGCAIDPTVVPEWRQSLPMITVEMREEVDEGLLRKRLAIVEVIHHDVCVRQQSHSTEEAVKV
jgi:hypothetical protein